MGKGNSVSIDICSAGPGATGATGATGQAAALSTVSPDLSRHRTDESRPGAERYQIRMGWGWD